MDQQAIEAILAQLKASFGERAVSARTLPDGRIAFKILAVALPPSCIPLMTSVWAVFSSQSAAPEIYVEQGIKVKGGIAPRNTYPETIEGEPVMRFSANLPYNPDLPLTEYIYGKLGRFTRAE